MDRLSYYKTSNYLFTMLKIIEPIIFAFLRGSALKKLALDIIRAMVKKTDNTVDDRLVDALEKALFPGR
tara:strand:+ start:2030 stop:2236 length:207 start_codon:yes stop_codon:yes gene_type:complete